MNCYAAWTEQARSLPTRQFKPDYYKVLEVDYDASDDTIKLSYRRLALKWHPDKHKGDNDVTAKFQEINEAYTVLSDPAKRLEYDLSGCYELNRYTLREYLTRFKGMILTCNGLGIDHSSKWARHLRELEPH
uniref:J domain-containing protein n=1 Tax=Oryza barthii TaxID=65489 RepID=A0A0D3F966_9ORYZ